MFRTLQTEHLQRAKTALLLTAMSLPHILHQHCLLMWAACCIHVYLKFTQGSSRRIPNKTAGARTSLLIWAELKVIIQGRNVTSAQADLHNKPPKPYSFSGKAFSVDCVCQYHVCTTTHKKCLKKSKMIKNRIFSFKKLPCLRLALAGRIVVTWHAEDGPVSTAVSTYFWPYTVGTQVL